MITWTTPALNVTGNAWCAQCAGSPNTAACPAPEIQALTARARRRLRVKQKLRIPTASPAKLSAPWIW
eukprot:3012708-Heterocapsa_arctica.AAC.1